jgi:glucoamylase
VLRIITTAKAMIRWTSDNWSTVNNSDTQATGLGCHWADLMTAELPAGAVITFTFQWAENWEGKNFTVKISPRA